ncbi:MAG TPA: group II truncated hemoglobin [Acidimicrobiia bacterium]|nr:group II truncated hemoglobin [Acidimicrobiia bacterium]
MIPRPGEKYPWGSKPTPYEEIGGDTRVRALVDAFYDIIDAESPELRAMLPSDMSISRQKLYEFLSGWMGGPQLYFERRGHPRLRLRHMPFRIDTYAAEEWSRCMSKALAAIDAGESIRTYLERELGTTARGLRNTQD